MRLVIQARGNGNGTSVAHRALHCRRSVELGSQAALTALLLAAFLTDVPETLSHFTLPHCLWANPHQAAEAKNAAVAEDVLQEMTGPCFLLTTACRLPQPELPDTTEL